MAEFPKTVPADPKGVLTGRRFMDGDHALAEGALAAGCRFFAGYPITPSTETAERFAERCPEVGGLFIQMEDEIASITANVGAVWGGQKVMTVTSGPGFSLMMEKGVGGDVQTIPGVHHPIFRNQTVNKDPRELFLSQLFKERGESNVFHDFYSALMQALYDHGVTPNVFCVNIDAVIAALLLKTLWARYRSGAFSEEALESAAFTAFLFGRTVGCAGEIDLPHQPRARHGHPHASIAMLLCRVR